MFPRLDPDSEYYLQLKFSAWLDSTASDAMIVMSIERAGTVYDWHGYFTAHQVPQEKKWTNCVANVMIPKKAAADDIIWIYILKEDKIPLYIDDLEVDFIRKK